LIHQFGTFDYDAFEALPIPVKWVRLPVSRHESDVEMDPRSGLSAAHAWPRCRHPCESSRVPGRCRPTGSTPIVRPPSAVRHRCVVVDPGRRALAEHRVEGRYLEFGPERHRRETDNGQRVNARQGQVALVGVLTPAGGPPQGRRPRPARGSAMRDEAAAWLLAVEEHLFLVAVGHRPG
jgi:hypothetical protein